LENSAQYENKVYIRPRNWTKVARSHLSAGQLTATGSGYINVPVEGHLGSLPLINDWDKHAISVTVF
jgi:hypothetical protein